ncbi:MAG TPA: ribokinase [Tepidisphaeraceae bacterium]|jgi:ribokinase|nr:ribokinase [Tepidisphaeraceae bacterium]
MAAPKKIVVVGSINMDLVARTERIPRPGETLLGDSFVTIPGGKGANQAVAAAKLAREGITVHMVGRVGDDDFGQRLLNGLTRHHVDTRHVTVSEGIASGVAVILVDRKGENMIVVAPGANGLLSPKDVDLAQTLITEATVVVLQCEIPPATVEHVIAMCQRHGVYTILDPTPVPANGLPRALYGVDVLTPNQLEAEALLGLQSSGGTTSKSAEDAKMIGTELLSRGARSVVLKRGSRGAVLIDRDGTIQTIKPFKVNVVDTTAAGDAFTAALAVARAEGMEPPAGVRFANAAGAACCGGFGAQPALPTREAVNLLLQI